MRPESKEKPVWDVYEEPACVFPASDAAYLEEVWLRALGGGRRREVEGEGTGLDFERSHSQ